MDQDAHGGISELSVGLKEFCVDVTNGVVSVLVSLSEDLVSEIIQWYKFSIAMQFCYFVTTILHVIQYIRTLANFKIISGRVSPKD